MPFATYMQIRRKSEAAGNEVDSTEELGFDAIVSMFEQHAPEAMSTMNVAEATVLFQAYSGSGKTSLGKS